MAKKNGLWVYRAYDEYGLPVCEAYSKEKLLNETIYEQGMPPEMLEKLTIKRVFIKGLE